MRTMCAGVMRHSSTACEHGTLLAQSCLLARLHDHTRPHMPHAVPPGLLVYHSCHSLSVKEHPTTRSTQPMQHSQDRFGPDV